MCFSAAASFTMAGVLAGGGAYCTHKALQSDNRYLPLAIMPIVVAVQQCMEGFAWIGAETGNQMLLNTAALSYMLFVWVFWPSWVPFMTARLEPRDDKRKYLLALAALGSVFGLFLYVPYFSHPDWLQVKVFCNSLVYETNLIPDQFIPRPLTAALYLLLVGATPLISSHYHLRMFGWSLIFFVPITHYLYVHAYISVLCFFAAAATLYLIYIVVHEKCPDAVPIQIKSKNAEWGSPWNRFYRS
jgi:hypothetical protein